MVKKSIDAEDKAIFRQAVRGVKRLSTSKLKSHKTSPLKKIPKIIDNTELPECQFSDYDKLPPVKSDEMIEYNLNHIPHKKLRKLRQGQYNVDAILDVHGMTVTEARTALHQFLRFCKENAASVILISHGKGRYREHPTLKNKLNHWLRQTDQVSGFFSTHQGGAMVVLLKKRGKTA